jgi:predicted NAD/FAD-dependent oxidoreductase
MGACWRLCRMLDVLELRLRQGCFGSKAQYVLVKVPLVVDLVDELVDAGRRLRVAALWRLRTDNLAVVDDELLVERGCRSVSGVS